MKIGVFLGSFDPPHIGHIAIASTVLSSKLVDKLYVVPAYSNPWKHHIASYDDRYHMCFDNFEVIENCCVHSVEKDLHEKYPEGFYTYDVLEELSKMHPNDTMYIVTTRETYNEIQNWYNGNMILDNYKFLIEGVEFCIPKINIHSTQIRDMLKSGINAYPYITCKTKHYIDYFNLYNMDKELAKLCKEYTDSFEEDCSLSKRDEAIENLTNYVNNHYKVKIDGIIEDVIDTLYINLDDIAYSPKDIKRVIREAMRSLDADSLSNKFKIKVLYE